MNIAQVLRKTAKLVKLVGTLTF